jgi:hypothetical protein
MAQKKVTSKSKTNVSDIVNDVIQAPLQDEKVRKVRALQKDKAVADSASLTVEKVTQSLTKAGLDISKTLNSVRELFESEIYSLQTIKDAIEAKQEEMESIYDKEVVAASLTDLVLHYEARKAELLKTEDEFRKAWAKEQAEHVAARIRKGYCAQEFRRYMEGNSYKESS